MARDQPNIQASILDRLIDREPGVSSEPVQKRVVTFSQVKDAVVRDLENLLNTRKNIQPLSAAERLVGESLFTYGLQDFTSQNPKSPSIRIQIRQELERTIALFEPRLRNLSVRFDTSEKGGENERAVRFRISALLVADPVTAPVTFDTYLDINRGEYFIPR